MLSSPDTGPAPSLWLSDHEAACRRQAQGWMEDSWSVPVDVLHRLWTDPTWRTLLRGTAVATREADPHNSPLRMAGLLLEIMRDGAEVRALDGRTARVETARLVIPRLDDIPDVDTVRKVAAEHDLQDGIGQLTRRGIPWRLGKYQAQAEFGWERHRRLYAGLAPVGPETAEALDVPGHPREQAVRLRTYRHPALGEREVIRLLSDAAAVGADMRAADAGCAPPDAGPPVLAARRPPLLGYPAWVALHDPGAIEQAREGLEVLTVALRTALTKPKVAFEQLQRYAAQKLPAAHAPAFWWEAVSVFDGSAAYVWNEHHEASKKARGLSREACSSSGLLADLDLWYALALDHHGDLAACCRALAVRDGAAAAHDAFREGALRNYSGTWAFKELREFAAAAGRDGVEQDAADLREYVRHNGEAMSISDSVLKARRKAFVRLAHTDDLSLRLMFTEPYQLLVLARSGVLGALLGDKEIAGKLLGGVLWPGSSPAEWLDVHHGENLRSGDVYEVCLDLLAFLAPALVADGRGIDLRDENGRVALNALDVACEHGVPLSHPVDEVALTAWYRSLPDTRRPLDHVAADPRYREPLKRAIAEFHGAAEPFRPPGNRPKPEPFDRQQLLDFPGLAPLAAEVFPDLASSVGSPSDALLRRALAGFRLGGGTLPEDRISTVRSMRAAAARLRGEAAEEAANLRSPAVHWALLIEHLGALAARAASPATAGDERAALIEFLGQWAEMPFVADPGRGWQYGALARRPKELGDAVLLYQGRFSDALGALEDDLWFVRPAPRPGDPDPLRDDLSALRDIDTGWATPARLAEFTGELAARGPLRWGKNTQEEAARLAKVLDAPSGTASLVFAGLPRIGNRAVLTAEQRKALKLKSGEDTGPRGWLTQIDKVRLLRLCAAVPPDSPATWWGRAGWDGAAERVADQWRRES